ncbi:unnamed protein product [Rangifer tarandus platyrhynchus]|uniref:Transmembrane protein n=1 Tax=Rangifer tarandus platyrhynchus TaxID=3082113 RepID=A0ABN8XJJ0_RANTA|nr:unnamed protein product [Rangifer tarandus platyrhynchus]
MASMQRVSLPGHKAHSFKDPEAPSVRDTGRQKRRTSTFVLALLAHQRAISGCRDVSGDAGIRRTVSNWRPFLIGSSSVGLVLFLFLAQQWIVKGALCAPGSMSAIARARSKAGIELTSPGARRLAERDTEDDDTGHFESIEEEPASWLRAPATGVKRTPCARRRSADEELATRPHLMCGCVGCNIGEPLSVHACTPVEASTCATSCVGLYASSLRPDVSTTVVVCFLRKPHYQLLPLGRHGTSQPLRVLGSERVEKATSSARGIAPRGEVWYYCSTQGSTDRALLLETHPACFLCGGSQRLREEVQVLHQERIATHEENNARGAALVGVNEQRTRVASCAGTSGSASRPKDQIRHMLYLVEGAFATQHTQRTQPESVRTLSSHREQASTAAANDCAVDESAPTGGPLLYTDKTYGG